jgi:hypothetical protein
MAQAIRDEVIEELLQGYSSPQDPFGEEGLFKELKKRLLERALGAELTEHLGYERGDPAGRGIGNSRNGYSSKTVIGDDGAIEIAVPRDRNGSFEPQLVAKAQTRLDGFDDRIISLYARGLSVREIQGHLLELYGVEVSPDLISRVTDTVLEEVRDWQNRPLDPVYPVIFFDALRVKIRDEGLVRNKAVYVTLAPQQRRREGGAGAVDRANRGCKVLAQGDERDQDPRRRRRPDRGSRRAQGLSRGDRRGVPADRSANLHHPPDPQLACFRVMEGPQAECPI